MGSLPLDSVFLLCSNRLEEPCLNSVRRGRSLVLETKNFSDCMSSAPLRPVSSTSEARKKTSGVLSGVMATLAFPALLALFNPDVSRARQETSDKDVYHLAAEYCRGTVPRPMSLSSDNRVLCFDGWVDDGMDLRSARELADHGLFVVRSLGGSIATSIALSDLLRDRRATVVIYDYCLSACASYFLVASDQTYVLKDSLVAWRNSVSGLDNCTSLKVPTDGGPKKLQSTTCPDISSEARAKHNAIMFLVNRFYSKRTFGPQFDPPPESLHIRRVLANLYEQTGVNPNVAWMLNPRYHATFKTKIDYEAYPENQEEVDAMVAPLHLGRVIYDP